MPMTLAVAAPIPGESIWSRKPRQTVVQREETGTAVLAPIVFDDLGNEFVKCHTNARWTVVKTELVAGVALAQRIWLNIWKLENMKLET